MCLLVLACLVLSVVSRRVERARLGPEDALAQTLLVRSPSFPLSASIPNAQQRAQSPRVATSIGPHKVSGIGDGDKNAFFAVNHRSGPQTRQQYTMMNINEDEASSSNSSDDLLAAFTGNASSDTLLVAFQDRLENEGGTAKIQLENEATRARDGVVDGMGSVGQTISRVLWLGDSGYGALSGGQWRFFVGFCASVILCTFCVASQPPGRGYDGRQQSGKSPYLNYDIYEGMGK